MQDSYKEVAIVLIAGSLMLLTFSALVIFAVFFYQKKRFQHREQIAAIQRELLHARLETQEETFQKISGELHDNFGQLLGSARILLEVAQRSFAQPPESLLKASETLAKAIHDLRTLSKSLDRDWLVRFDLVENLRGEADRINGSQPVHIGLLAPANLILLNPDEQIIIFRIVQEAIHNSLKHSGGSEVLINIEKSGNVLLIEVTDNGIGFDRSKISVSGVGIQNMERRAKMLGGSIQWHNKTKGGTRVQLLIKTK